MAVVIHHRRLPARSGTTCRSLFGSVLRDFISGQKSLNSVNITACSLKWDLLPESYLAMNLLARSSATRQTGRESEHAKSINSDSSTAWFVQYSSSCLNSTLCTTVHWTECWNSKSQRQRIVPIKTRARVLPTLKIPRMLPQASTATNQPTQSIQRAQNSRPTKLRRSS